MLHNQLDDHSYPSPGSDKNSIPPDEQSKIRLILACFAGVLAILSFVAFIVTGNTNVLLGTSALAYPLLKIIDYYFGSNKP